MRRKPDPGQIIVDVIFWFVAYLLAKHWFHWTNFEAVVFAYLTDIASNARRAAR